MLCCRALHGWPYLHMLCMRQGVQPHTARVLARPLHLMQPTGKSLRRATGDAAVFCPIRPCPPATQAERLAVRCRAP